MIKLKFVKINPREKSTRSQFTKLNPREMLKKNAGQKQIHAKISLLKVYLLPVTNKRFIIGIKYDSY